LEFLPYIISRKCENGTLEDHLQGSITNVLKKEVEHLKFLKESLSKSSFFEFQL